MRKVKSSLVIICMLIASICMLIPNNSKALLSKSVYFGVSLIRENSATNACNGKDAGKNIGYSIGMGDNVSGQTRQRATIWNIMQYQDNSAGTVGTSGNFYCIREGVGFTSADNTGDKIAIAEYTASFDFTNKSSLSNIEPIKTMSDDDYYSLLALSDLLYLEEIDNKEEYLAKSEIGIEKDYYDSETVLTDSDIKAVQQAAIWYFTNHDTAEFQTIFDNTQKSSWLYYTTTTTDSNALSSLSDYDLGFSNVTGSKYGSGMDRNEQANILYNYLITTSKNNAENYKNGSVTPKTNITAYTNLSSPSNTQPIISIDRKKITGEYGVKIVKQDSTNGNKLSGAVFNVNNTDKTATNSNGETVVESNKKIEGTNQTDEYIITEKTAPSGYNKFDGTIKLTVKTKIENGNYVVDTANTKMTVTDKNGTEITSNIPVSIDKTTGLITITVKNTPLEYSGKYSVNLVKEDASGEQLNSKATFEVNGQTKEVVGKLAIAEDVEITAENVDKVDKYTIKETKAPDEYCEFNGIINITVTKTLVDKVYKVEKVDYTVTDDKGNDITNQTGEKVKVHLNEDGNIYVEVRNYQFDLKLVKRIVDINGTKVPERIRGVDVTKLANRTATTADYDLDKSYVSVKKGDIVKYTLRVYNEGEIDGYASEITEDIPEGLELVWSEKTAEEIDADTTLTQGEKEAIKYNQLIWDIKDINRETNRIEMVTTDYLAYKKGAEIANNGANLIKAFDYSKQYVNTINDKNPDYKEISVYMKVVSDKGAGTVIRNEAAITEDSDSEGNPVDDRDSDTEKWVKYEDDEDYDNVILQSFDLALRKFITGVNQNEVDSRIPQVKYDKEKGKITYEHTKDPVDVVTNDIVIYTIRVFNEGETDGFASKVSDDLPAGLEYLPDNELNKEYRWVMYDKDGNETTEVSKATKITTDYLSREQGEARMKEDSEDKENPALLKAFDKNTEVSETNPDYADVKVAFKVVEPNTSSKVIVNSAQISDDTDKNGNPVDDIDSTPDKWIEGEDDQDKEYVKLSYFDLALRKWVTQAIVIENGKETVTQTGHKAEDDPEQVVKVELNRKKLSSLAVKFKYSIRVTNEGEIAGYAKEITDYIPEGLKFDAKDNPDWKDEGNNVISTRKLENTLLQPGESAEVTVTLTWINGKDNLGLKINTAEISEDYNDRGVPDRDSTPDNKKPGEDDIDDAPVLLSISTGGEKIYTVLGLTVLITIAGGVILIKKFVL